MVRLTQEQKDLIVEMRRTHSLKEIAAITEIPLGTVRTICFRAGVKAPAPNSEHAAFFVLPEPQEAAGTQLAAFQLPEERTQTGDREVDAFLWLLEVIDSGDPALIGQAMTAAEGMKSTPEELAKRYSSSVLAKTGNAMAAAFAGFGWDDLKGRAERAIQKRVRACDAVAIFGDDIHEPAKQEYFCIEALKGLERGKFGFLDPQEVDSRFEQYPHLIPSTIEGCILEFTFWRDLWRLKSSVDDDTCQESYEREQYLWRLMAKIRPRSKEEAAVAFKFMLERDDRQALVDCHEIISNLLRG
ncbi:hypothetical protein [Aeromonas caviae]|uniref:hypothetical protein n=1 Tax=Aeromonas caviae TaxID=648 RepID=UPI001CC66A4C|nr:hypothetical protein [Aeromonas caviae]GJB04323.1 hypothetical protein KAM360_32660 [Aeromonas caviae]GKR44775.1 hypothetical protein KAM473_22940 [Aeromonas caviae]GKR52887.1 hypothetical protein KAM475_20340 [Aeromonas caviae]GKR63538.1 hypothetical protein KAM477_41600 [Aeromonas caviae]GKR87584.1 hypothetical protein KAM483_24850 [Aeromonas caviae]